MLARLIDENGRTIREWLTTDKCAAMTADRNCPMGWQVMISDGTMMSDQERLDDCPNDTRQASVTY